MTVRRASIGHCADFAARGRAPYAAAADAALQGAGRRRGAGARRRRAGRHRLYGRAEGSGAAQRPPRHHPQRSRRRLRAPRPDQARHRRLQQGGAALPRVRRRSTTIAATCCWRSATPTRRSRTSTAPSCWRRAMPRPRQPRRRLRASSATTIRRSATTPVAIRLMPQSAAPLAGRGRVHLAARPPARRHPRFHARGRRGPALRRRLPQPRRSQARHRAPRPDAIEDLSRAIAFDVNNAELYLLRGQAYLRPTIPRPR